MTVTIAVSMVESVAVSMRACHEDVELAGGSP